ncbi:MAG: class I SAM-dependent methyltransferase [SAR324 cluster bacterium]|nr:class I SAM-dependent methyltransferase [SAR324 cluster bacterium]
MTQEWFQDFFQGMALELWRKAIPEEQTRAEADFLATVLGVKPGVRLLDVPCGNGRLALELASRGCRVSGVDLAAPFIREAKSRAKRLAVTADFKRVDMRELPWEEEFDGAFCFGNSFGYFAKEGVCAFLEAVGRALKPGGRFVLDTELAAESILPDLADRAWSQVGNMRLLVEHHYDAAQSRLDTVYTFIRGAKTEIRSARHWVYTTGEIGRMLASAGLTVQALYSNLEQEPYMPGAPRLLLVAEKRKPGKRRTSTGKGVS